MQPMFYRNILALCLAAGVASCANTGDTGYSSGYGERDRDPAPPADPNRKISQQDCSKPFFPDGGNLRCM